MEFAALLKFTVAMLHVVRTLRFARSFRIYCLFLLLQNILRLRDEIMLIVSTITNCFLKQYSVAVQYQKGTINHLLLLTSQCDKICEHYYTNSTTPRGHVGITFVVLCINIRSGIKVQKLVYAFLSPLQIIKSSV
jgi:hypothetical protein